MRALTVEDVCRIHDALCTDFADSNDPIFPPGIKSVPLLESAVGRQHVGFQSHRKYSTPLGAAATLTFGLCNDHPFHNGNKRTALVAMLAHMDANKLILRNTRQEDLFEMILALATTTMCSKVPDRRKKPRATASPRNSPDAEVNALMRWLEARQQSVRRGERQVTYRELRVILHKFNVELLVPSANSIGVYRVSTKRRLLSTKPSTPVYTRLGTIGYHSEGQQVAISEIKKVRRFAGLREEDGTDSDTFYGDGVQFDVFINQYRTILRRLARR